MAERVNKQKTPDAPMSDALTASMDAAQKRVAERQGARSASDALNDEATRRPFSMRLTARELQRLRVMALLEEEGATELARRLLLEGLLRLEAKHLADPKRAQLADVVDHLNAQVDATKAIIGILMGGLADQPVPQLVEQPRRKLPGRSVSKRTAATDAMG